LVLLPSREVTRAGLIRLRQALPHCRIHP